MLQQGFVSKILTRPYNGKTMYSLALVNQDGLFGFGAFPPKAGVGDKVEFDAEKNEKGYWQAKGGSLKVVAGASQESVQQAPKASQAGSYAGKDDYWNRKEVRDLKQDELREIGATRNTAIEWIKLLLSQEALKLPAKAPDKEAALNALLEDTVTKFRSAPAKQIADKAQEASVIEPQESVPWN